MWLDVKATLVSDSFSRHRGCSRDCFGPVLKHMGWLEVDSRRKGCSGAVSDGYRHFYPCLLGHHNASTIKVNVNVAWTDQSRHSTVTKHGFWVVLTEFCPTGTRFWRLLLGIISKLVLRSQLSAVVARGIRGMPLAAMAWTEVGRLPAKPLRAWGGLAVAGFE